MPYLIDRQRALFTGDVVAILAVRQRRGRSRVILKDNSLYQTLTRPKTLARRLRAGLSAIERAGAGRPRGRANG
ncbi:MAG: hypothetical protein HYZ91_02050 [Candidatus Omnitrophica bacterium]|nr:hypothetical protein [Candidatus Omnitrophota bacterium]